MGKGVGFGLLLFTRIAFTQNTHWVEFSDSIFLASQKNQEFPGLTVSYYSSDTSWVSSYGVKKWNSDQVVDPYTRFQLGSIGKVLTTISVLQLVEDGQLDLEEDVTKYIQIEIGRFGQEAVTLEDLLTHSAGMNDRNVGYLARNADELASLENHLQTNLPSFFQSAGTDINYSNYSYALAGYIVERTSGVPFHQYVRVHILDPLKMDSSFVGFDFDYQSKSGFAQGHTRVENGFKPQEEYARPALPSGSFISNAIDMKKLLEACVKRDSMLLNDESWDLLFTRQFSNHDLLPGYSMGLEEQVANGQVYWAKGGMLTGYQSQLIFWPDTTAMFVAINSNDDSFLEHFHKAGKQRFYAEKEVETEPLVETDLSIYVGEYRNARYDRQGVESIISLFRGAFEVWEGDSSLLAWHNGEMHNYYHIGNHAFQNSTDADIKMVFVEEEDRIVKLYRGINIGGLSVPSTFEKTRWYNSPSFINEYYGVVPLGILLYSLSILFAIAISAIRNWKPGFRKGKLLSPVCHIMAGVGILAVVTHIIQVFIPMIKSPVELLFGLSDQFIRYNNLSYLIIGITFGLWILMIYASLAKKGALSSRIFYVIFTLLMSIHSWFLMYWNFV